MADKEIKAEATVVLNTKGIDEGLKRARDGAKKTSDEFAKGNDRQRKDVQKTAEAYRRAYAGFARAAQKAASDTTAANEQAKGRMAKAWAEFSKAAIKSARAASNEQKKTAADVAKSSEDAAQRASKAWASFYRAAYKQSRDQKREEDARVRESQRYQERLTQQHRDAVAKRAQEELRQEQKSVATRKKLWQEAVRSARGIAGGIIGGAIAGGAVVASQGRSMAGVADVRSRVEKANDTQRRLIVLGGDAKLDGKGVAAMRDQVNATSQQYGIDPEKLVAGLEDAHGRFNLLQSALANLGEYTKTATAKGIDFGDLVNMMGSAKSAYGLKDEEMPAAMATLISGASVGAIGAKDLAGTMASGMGSHAMASGQKGLEGVRQFSGLAQGIGTGQFGAAETETRMNRLMDELNDVGTAKKLRAIGVKVRNKDGQIDVGSVVDQLAANKQFQNAGVRQGIFKEIRGRQGIETLIAAKGRSDRGEAGAVDFKSVHDVSAQEGTDSVNSAMGMMESSGLLDAGREAARMQADTLNNLKFYNDQVVAVAKTTNDLQTAVGDVGRFAELWGGAMAATGAGGFIGSKLSGGGGEGGMLGTAANLLGGTAIAKGAGALWAKGTAATVGTGGFGAAAGTAAAWGGGAALAGGAGYGIGMLIDKGVELAVNKKLSTIIGELATGDVDRARAAQLAGGKSGAVGSTTGEAAIVRAIGEGTKATKAVEARLSGGRPAQPQAGNRNPGAL